VQAIVPNGVFVIVRFVLVAVTAELIGANTPALLVMLSARAKGGIAKASSATAERRRVSFLAMFIASIGVMSALVDPTDSRAI
jgi:hypothetical protein